MNEGIFPPQTNPSHSDDVIQEVGFPLRRMRERKDGRYQFLASALENREVGFLSDE
jgi:hypothetical protein